MGIKDLGSLSLSSQTARAGWLDPDTTIPTECPWLRSSRSGQIDKSVATSLKLLILVVAGGTIESVGLAPLPDPEADACVGQVQQV